MYKGPACASRKEEEMEEENPFRKEKLVLTDEDFKEMKRDAKTLKAAHEATIAAMGADKNTKEGFLLKERAEALNEAASKILEKKLDRKGKKELDEE